MSAPTPTKRTGRHRSLGTHLARIDAKRKALRGKFASATTVVQSSELIYAGTTSVSVSSTSPVAEIHTPEEPESSKTQTLVRPTVARKGSKPALGDHSVVSTQRESPSISRGSPDGLERSPSSQQTSSKTISRLIALSHEEEVSEPFGSFSEQIEADAKPKKIKKVPKRTQQLKTSKHTFKKDSMELFGWPKPTDLSPTSSASLDEEGSQSTESRKRASKEKKTKSKHKKADAPRSFPRDGTQKGSIESLEMVPDETEKIEIERDLGPSKASVESLTLLRKYSQEPLAERVSFGADEITRRKAQREFISATDESQSSSMLSSDISKLSSTSTSSDSSSSVSDTEEVANEHDKLQQVVAKEVVEEDTPSTTKKSAKAKRRKKKPLEAPIYKEARNPFEAEQLEREGPQSRFVSGQKKKRKKRVKTHLKGRDDEETEQFDDGSSIISSDTGAEEFAVADEGDLEGQEEEHHGVHVVRKHKMGSRLSTSQADDDEHVVSVARKRERKKHPTKATAKVTTDEEEQITIEPDDVIFNKRKRRPSIELGEPSETKKRGRRRAKKHEMKYAGEDGSQEEQDTTSPSLPPMPSAQESSLVNVTPKFPAKHHIKKAKPPKHSRSSLRSSSRWSSIADSILRRSKGSEDKGQSTLVDSTLLPSELSSTTVSETAEDTYSCPFTPVQCEWFLDSHTLVCRHPVLGDIRSRPRVVSQSKYFIYCNFSRD